MVDWDAEVHHDVVYYLPCFYQLMTHLASGDMEWLQEQLLETGAGQLAGNMVIDCQVNRLG